MGVKKLIKTKGGKVELDLEGTYLLFQNLIYKYAYDFKNCGSSTEDLVQIGSIGLMKAFNTYDEEAENLFISYLGTCIRNEILMNYRKVVKYRDEISYDNFMKDEDDDKSTFKLLLLDTTDYAELAVEKIALEGINKYMFSLPDREKIIFRLYFKEEVSQKEIGALLGISQSYVCRRVKKIKELLKKLYDRGII